MDKYIGKVLDGRYEILEEVGNGGMAVVYKAKDFDTGAVVAVKILREEYLDNEEFCRRFRNESRAIALLNHPNIVKIFDVCNSPTLQYIVMEYIDGISLKDYIEQQRVVRVKEAFHDADSACAHACPFQGHRSPRHQAAEHHAAAQRPH